ncbi:MAG: PAS domain-containing protein [Verrucomicrobiae bacterium]|nr:PAS domain-containing protein [Verrucomicrobiae bacterium]
MWTAVALALAAALVASHAWWGWRWHRARLRFDRDAARARELERHLRDELERDRAGQTAAFNCMVEGLLVLGPDARVQWINRPLQQIFALPDDMRGRTLIEALRRHELEELAQRARLEGQALGYELELHGPHPRILQVNATTSGNGDPRHRLVILVFHDVTRLKELESTRREFVANVSHELRTPLALIKGYVETLIDGARHDPEVALRFLQTIEKHTNRLTFLIEDLLTISQLEAGQVVMNRQAGELHPLVARVFEDFTARAADRQVQLVNAVPEDLSLRVDFDRLQQVLFNLIDNAIKYGRAGGRVTVGAQTNPRAARAELWVADDGPGIPREALDRVFERFYRVDAARSREQGGTGLGLSIVKHIVQAHGGEVRAESESGKGATFRLTLPWDPPPPNPPIP